jgi:hypothetical protein
VFPLIASTMSPLFVTDHYASRVRPGASVTTETRSFQTKRRHGYAHPETMPCPGGLTVPSELPADENQRGYQVSRLARDGATALTIPDWVPHLTTAATNDRMRGAGTFDRVLDRIAVLRRHASSRSPSRS